jgi:hypothetical protein
MKTMRDLREWVNEKDEHGYLMPDEFVVGVTYTAIYARNRDCLVGWAGFETTSDEEDEA